jgi:hypothetical protein
MSASLKKSARQLASTYFHSLSEEDKEEFLNELRNEPPKSSKKSSKKADSDSEDKPKRVRSEKLLTLDRIYKIVREALLDAEVDDVKVNKEGKKTLAQAITMNVGRVLYEAKNLTPSAEEAVEAYNQYKANPTLSKKQQKLAESKKSTPVHSEDEAEDEAEKAPVTPTKKEAPKKKEAVPKKPEEPKEEEPKKKEAPKKKAPAPTPPKVEEEEEELPPMETELWKHKGKVYMRSTEEPHFCWLWNEKTAEQGAYKGVYDVENDTFDESYPEPGL